MGKEQNAYKIFMGKRDGRRPIGTPEIMLEDNNKINLRGIEWVAWTGLIWLRIGRGRGPL
jgi:hypothetical protein